MRERPKPQLLFAHSPFVYLSLLLTWGSAQAQNEKQTPVTKLPGEENLSLRERAERDFLMPVRRKKAVVEAPLPGSYAHRN